MMRWNFENRILFFNRFPFFGICHRCRLRSYICSWRWLRKDRAEGARRLFTLEKRKSALLISSTSWAMLSLLAFEIFIRLSDITHNVIHFSSSFCYSRFCSSFFFFLINYLLLLLLLWSVFYVSYSQVNVFFFFYLSSFNELRFIIGRRVVCSGV